MCAGYRLGRNLFRDSGEKNGVVSFWGAMATGPERAAGIFAILTLIFAVGQVLGPAGAGFLADWTGGFAAAYGVTTGLNCVAVILCLFLRPPPSRVGADQ